MIFNRYIFLLAVIPILFGSCERRRQNTAFEIFNLDQFLNGQVEYLAKQNAGLKKQSGIGDSVEIIILDHDSAGWAKELSIFRTADIHKPGLRAFYGKEEYERGQEQVTKYELEDTTQSETIYLKIIRKKDSENIAEIEALQRTDNPIYSSRRKLLMRFYQENENTVRLDSFSVTGYQKMITQDSVTYLTNGKVVLTE